MNKTSIITSFFLSILITSCKENKIEITEIKPSTEEIKITKIPNFLGVYIYKSENDSLDKSILTISEKGKDFVYNLKTSVRNVNGKLSMTDDGYLILEGISWDEYKGNISEEVDSENRDVIVESNLEIPKEIEAVLDADKNEIVIQNTGNSMNYYVKLGEIDEKYIHFKKQ